MVRERASAYLPWLVVSNWINGPDSLRFDLNHNSSRQFSGSKGSISPISFYRIQFIRENSSKIAKSNQFEKQIAETPAKTKIATKKTTNFPFCKWKTKWWYEPQLYLKYVTILLLFHFEHDILHFGSTIRTNNPENIRSNVYNHNEHEQKQNQLKTKKLRYKRTYRREIEQKWICTRCVTAVTFRVYAIACACLLFFSSLLFSFYLPHSVLAFSDRLLKPNIHTIKYLFNADFSLVSMRPHTAKIRSNTSKCLCCSPKTLSFQQFKNSFVSLQHVRFSGLGLCS